MRACANRQSRRAGQPHESPAAQHGRHRTTGTRKFKFALLDGLNTLIDDQLIVFVRGLCTAADLACWSLVNILAKRTSKVTLIKTRRASSALRRFRAFETTQRAFDWLTREYGSGVQPMDAVAQYRVGGLRAAATPDSWPSECGPAQRAITARPGVSWSRSAQSVWVSVSTVWGSVWEANRSVSGSP